MGREITNIRSCDIVVIVGGRIGTLGEFAIAYDEGRLIGVLTGRRNHRPHPRDHQPPFGLPYEGAQHPATAGVIAVALRDPWGSTALKTQLIVSRRTATPDTVESASVGCSTRIRRGTY